MPNEMQPIYIMPEDSVRSYGKTAQRNNIAAGIAVGDCEDNIRTKRNG
jgi:hypothetical protein